MQSLETFWARPCKCLEYSAMNQDVYGTPTSREAHLKMPATDAIGLQDATAVSLPATAVLLRPDSSIYGAHETTVAHFV